MLDDDSKQSQDYFDAEYDKGKEQSRADVLTLLQK